MQRRVFSAAQTGSGLPTAVELFLDGQSPEVACGPIKPAAYKIIDVGAVYQVPGQSVPRSCHGKAGGHNHDQKVQGHQAQGAPDVEADQNSPSR